VSAPAPHGGGCLCGRIRYEARGEPDHVVHCYCSMCRRQSGTALQTFARFARAEVHFEGDEPARYRSSERVVRCFCRECGSSLSFAYDHEPAHLWLMAGSFDHPERLMPTAHFLAEDRVPWIPLDPALPGFVPAPGHRPR
jgi:hypothetical protein